MSGDAKQGADFSDKVDRRKFIGAAAATAGMLFLKPELVRGRTPTPLCVWDCSDAGDAGPKMQPT